MAQEKNKSSEEIGAKASTPEILAPAGDKASFLAALSAGADAIYVGLKAFSARMRAENFSITELARLSELARRQDAKVYVAMNTLVKPNEAGDAGRLIQRLERTVKPDAIILQDIGLLEIIRQVGFSGEVHLSTLANAGQAAALSDIYKMGVRRVVLPRELNIEEIKASAEACPEGMLLEVFVHGALCYNVSGRCWWSSRYGGRSALRGRCVQPCRRRYTQGKESYEYFSCKDLSLDVLAEVLLNVPQVAAWKIEGRKKGPHYVFYTVSAYRMLRDKPKDAQTKKIAVDLLSRALSRPGTHSVFLPQRPHSPVGKSESSVSGLLAGKVSGGSGGVWFKPRFPLQAGDLLRIGFEDDPWHRTMGLRRGTPKAGRVDLPPPKGRMRKRPPAGTPVYLIDRRDKELSALLREQEKLLDALPTPKAKAAEFEPLWPKGGSAVPGRSKPMTMTVRHAPPTGKVPGILAMWLFRESLDRSSRTLKPKIWWWLPPVVWPNEEEAFRKLLHAACRQGARRFVLGAPWQSSLFEDDLRKELRLWAGPYCNITNVFAVQVLKEMGFAGAIVSPELGGDDMLALPKHSPLPLGAITGGRFPLGLSRLIPEDVKPGRPLASPRGEICYTRRIGQNLWIFPEFELDLREKEAELAKAGYSTFVRFAEYPPKGIEAPEKGDVFNWEQELL